MGAGRVDVAQDVRPPFFRCRATAVAAAVIIVCLLVLARPPPARSMTRCSCCGGDCNHAAITDWRRGANTMKGDVPCSSCAVAFLSTRRRGGGVFIGNDARRPCALRAYLGSMGGWRGMGVRRLTSRLY